MTAPPDPHAPAAVSTPRIAGGAAEASPVVRDWNRQLQRIDRLQAQLAEQELLARQHRQALQAATAPVRQALTGVQQALARRLVDALEGKQLAGAYRPAALARLATLATALLAAGDASARDAHDRLSDIPLAERQARARADWQERVQGWRRETDAQQADRAARQARRESRRARREAERARPDAAPGAPAPVESAPDDPATLLRRLFRQLASALHPDREADAQQRERKTALMAEANRAHGSGDLPALLRLQQQVLQAEPASQWDDTRLAALVQLLRQQVADLERERAAQQQALAWEAGLPGGVPARDDTLAQARDAAVQALEQAWQEARDTLARTATSGGLQRWLASAATTSD